jgi:hypothetical protein
MTLPILEGGDMFSFKPRMAILSALTAAALVGSLGMTSLPASAATQRPAPAGTSPRPAGEIVAKGAILCSGDLCLQNDGVYGDRVTVTEWAYNRNFFGHFELADEAGDVANSHQNWWYGGGRGWAFQNFPAHCNLLYAGAAWRYTHGHYYLNGSIYFRVC